MSKAPEVVSLRWWGLRAVRLPWAFAQVAGQRHALGGVPGLRFGRILGTGRGRTFTVGDADPTHWALLTAWDCAEAEAAFARGPLVRGWEARSNEGWSVRMRPLSSTGRWSGTEPFGPCDPAAVTSGPCAVLTRARIATRQLIAFGRAVPPVAADLPKAAGLRFARGIGEAPIGLQATFSIWDSLASAKNFAYQGVAHRDVIGQTLDRGWYTEQLFARFAIIDAAGLVDGRDPLARPGAQAPEGAAPR